MPPLPHFSPGPIPGRDLIARFNPLDWALALAVAVSTVAAFMKGLIRSLIALAGVIAGILLAAFYAPGVALWLRQWVPQPMLAEVIAFVGILAGCYLVAVLVGRVLRGACSAVGLGFLDRLGGSVFGFLRAVLALSALMVPVSPFLSVLPLTRDSVLLPYLRTAAHGISFVMPRDFAERLPAVVRLPKQSAPGRGNHSALASESLPDPGTAEGDAQ